MNQDTLNELHRIELDLLARFTDICNSENIIYYIIGGTLLGAVRHGGFIPWDDDVDIAVPRDDYYRLIRVMHKVENEEIGMQYYKDDPSLYFYPIKIISKKYKVTDPRSADGYGYPWLDILPIDGFPDGKIRSSVFHFRMSFNRMLLGLHYIDRIRAIKRPWYQQAAIAVGRKTQIGRLIDPTKVKDRIDHLLSSHRIEDCEQAGTCMGAYFFKEFVPKDYFGSGVPVRFDTLELNAPEQIDAYLTHMYGDYLTLPPEEKRKPEHSLELIER